MWYIVGFFCLGVIFYYGTVNIEPESTYQSLLKKDGGDPVIIGRITDPDQVSVGVHLDVDADPYRKHTIEFSPQRDVGMFLEVDGGPRDHLSPGVGFQQNEGVFLDVEGGTIVSDFVVSNEQKTVNVGEFIDPGASE